MTDREKIIKGLELCGYQEGMPQCDSCPYDGKQCWKRLKTDALELLKAQDKDAEIIRKCREGKVLKHVGDGIVVLNYDWWRKMVEKCDHIKIVPSVEDLLKAQEPVEPTIGRCEEYDGHDSWWYQCGKCQKPIDYDDKYCRTCGQAVKWDG